MLELVTVLFLPLAASTVVVADAVKERVTPIVRMAGIGAPVQHLLVAVPAILHLHHHADDQAPPQLRAIRARQQLVGPVPAEHESGWGRGRCITIL
jgi:hypothetical protein